MHIIAKPLLALFFGISVLFTAGCASTDDVSTESSPASKAVVDFNQFNGSAISKDSPVHVHLFSIEETDLGDPQYIDTAKTMAASAPHLLATDIVMRLRAAGFTKVTLDASENQGEEHSYNIQGKFTVLEPGSQDLRRWIGFGAGKSKVGVEGSLSDATGAAIGSFSDCDSGLGWGKSAPQMKEEASTIGDAIGNIIVSWSK